MFIMAVVSPQAYLLLAAIFGMLAIGAVLTGTYDISTLLKARFQSAAEFGLDTIEKVLKADVAAHNTIVQDVVSNLATLTTERQRKYGTSVGGDMIEVDEYGRSPTQRDLPGSTVGFPLKKFQYAIGWTEMWFQLHTPADMAAAVQSAEKAHLRAIQRQIKLALFLSSNYTFTDFLVDKIDLAVKRLVNADSAAIPDGPNGEQFDGTTHTHYSASATLTTAAVDALINNVVEHGHGNRVMIAISRTDEAAFRALTGFTKYEDPRLIFRTTNTPGPTLDITRLNNRAIGLYGAAEFWVKPWALANYAVAWDSGAPDESKPLAFRQRSQTTLQGLRIAAKLSTYPLNAEYMEDEFGVAANERTTAAVLQFNNASYQDPTIP